MATNNDTEWREWLPLSTLTDSLPHHFQRGLSTAQLELTCLASFPEHLVLGTNVGLVYLAHLPTLNLMRLRCEVRFYHLLFFYKFINTLIIKT